MRRTGKYNVKIRGGRGDNDTQDIHWSSKKRFVPNGTVQNFTPQLKPYRRPSYNAFLQAINVKIKIHKYIQKFSEISLNVIFILNVIFLFVLVL